MGGENNGGFPEPLAGEAVRLVRCTHEVCGAATRVRLPQVLPATVVRHLVCDGCHEPFDSNQIFDVGVAHPLRPHPAQPGGPFSFHGRAWRYLSIPIAAAIVGGALALIERLG